MQNFEFISNLTKKYTLIVVSMAILMDETDCDVAIVF